MSDHLARLASALGIVCCTTLAACLFEPDTGIWPDVNLEEYSVLPLFRAGEPHAYWDAFLASTEYSYSEMAVDSQIVVSAGQLCIDRSLRIGLHLGSRTSEFDILALSAGGMLPVSPPRPK